MQKIALTENSPASKPCGWAQDVKERLLAKHRKENAKKLKARAWSKEVWKSNFLQYGPTKSRDGKSQRRVKKRNPPKKEDPGARKGRKVAKQCGSPMISGLGGSKSRLAEAASAEPASLTAVAASSGPSVVFFVFFPPGRKMIRLVHEDM